MSELAHQLQHIESISLAEMDKVALLNRTDTKFVLSSTQLVPLLKAVQEDYRVLEIDARKQMRYRTHYFDTEALDFYFDHHNRHGSRMKVRMREYVDSDLCFLEIKKKQNTGRTAKKRTRIPDLHTDMSAEDRQYIQNITGFSEDLHLSLTNKFKRITLVHKRRQERFTIDADLSFLHGAQTHSLPKVVVAEIKQERASRDTASFRIMRSLGLRPMGMSKYCLGTLLLRDGIKYNRFKPTLLYLQKL